MSRTRAIALTIAGSDPSGGAGIQADLKTFTVLGVYGASVITALTAQNTVGVTGVHKVPADFIRAQFEAVVSDLSIAAAKTGMLGDEETVLTVAGLVRRAQGSKTSSSIRSWWRRAATCCWRPRPSRPCAKTSSPLPPSSRPTCTKPRVCSIRRIAEDEATARRQAEALLRLGPAAVLVKGGHGAGGEAVDFLARKSGTLRFAKPRIATRNTHGTGCTLAAAITAGLAQGLELADAVARAKDFLWAALDSGAHMRFGAGQGPVDHLAVIAPAKE